MALVSTDVYATTDFENTAVDHDSVEISLLTCAPGQEVYSLYGHTAIRVNYKSNSGFAHQDYAVNYGMFSFRKPFFILRFIFGLTDYEMGIMPFYAFSEEYGYSGRRVIEQTLNLTAKEKAVILAAIARNYQPENREYRYNYFYDNCTTRARDIIVNNIDGKVDYGDTLKTYPSYRKLIHEMNENERWARLGNDLLLGVKADKKTDVSEHQFLPFNLMHDFAKAKIVGADGRVRLLVSKTNVVVDASPVKADDGFPLTPAMCGYVLLAVIVVLTILEWRLKRNFWLLDTLLLVFTGIAGIIIFLMLFSEHPTTSTNLQILILNPLPLVFIWRVVKRMRNMRYDSFWLYAEVLIILFIICGIWQDYADGMYALALSLLVRSRRRLLKYKK